MGFCRRCGDIVSGTRCKCGGTAVAPVVAWKESNDPWTKTYVARDKSPTRPPHPSVDTSITTNSTRATSTSPTKRFPRPLSSYSSSSSSSHPIGKRVTEHITATTSQLNRPPSPLKNSTVASPESGILPSLNPNSGSLAKVYGSVLQSKESLATHSCALCGTVFPPDGTIYPEPYAQGSDSPRFLCRDCFTTNGGSKGQCPSCSRPVLALKSEGPFIEAAGAFWHKACFTCEGCSKNIGDSPMLDLLGRPSCAECFDTCLKRDRTPKKNRSSTTSLNSSPSRNAGGIGSSGSKSREGTPTIEELEQRLGIVKSRQSSPAIEEFAQRLSLAGSSPRVNRHSIDDSSRSSPSPKRTSVALDDSPIPDRIRRFSRTDMTLDSERRDSSRNRTSTILAQRTGSNSPAPEPTLNQIEEMKRRFMKPASSSSQASPAASPLTSPAHLPRLRSSRSSGSLSTLPNRLSSASPEAQTPDLLSDFSDTATQSSGGPDSPPRNVDENDDAFLIAKLYSRGLGTRYARSGYLEDHDDVIVEETSSQLNTPKHTPKHNTVSSTKTTPVTTPSKAPVTSRSQNALREPNSSPSAVAGPQISATTSCAKCKKRLFSVREGGQYVTVPDGTTGAPRSYHTKCFTCSVCDREFKRGAEGQAAFVKGERGPCHVECAPPAKINVRMVPSPVSNPLPPRPRPLSVSTSSPSSSSPNSGTYVSSRYTRPPVSAPSNSSSMPRFGGANPCPGCLKPVPQVSFGISAGERSAQGPNGTRWHVMCLVCGGRKEPSNGVYLRGRDERKKGEPGCGKKLDSAAKTHGESGVFCRECWLLLPMASPSPQGSPTRSPIMPSYTGSGKVAPQYTGTTTLARQFTGLTGSDASAPLLKQLTGGGLSPTRSLSPTKQLGSFRPRPKSVIGMRSSKSVDEGRGMFLVRQMTGTGDKG